MTLQEMEKVNNKEAQYKTELTRPLSRDAELPQ